MSNQLLRQRSISEIISHSFQFFASFFKIIFTILFMTAIPFMLLNSIIIFIANVMIVSPTEADRFLIFMIIAIVFVIYLAIYIGFVAEFMEAYRLNPTDLSFRELIFRLKQNFFKHIITMLLFVLLIYPFGLDIESNLYSEIFYIHLLKFIIVCAFMSSSHMYYAHQRKNYIESFIGNFRLNAQNIFRSISVTVILTALFAGLIYFMIFVLLQFLSIPEMEIQQLQLFDLAAIALLIFYVFIILLLLPIFFLGLFFHYYDIYERVNDESLLNKIDEI